MSMRDCNQGFEVRESQGVPNSTRGDGDKVKSGSPDNHSAIQIHVDGAIRCAVENLETHRRLLRAGQKNMLYSR